VPNGNENVPFITDVPPAEFVVSVKGRFAMPAPFVAVNVITPELAAVGVPESSPLELNVMPVGSVPLVTLQVIGKLPRAVNCCKYAEPTVPLDRLAGKMLLGVPTL
jgi:hypothetical protein